MADFYLLDCPTYESYLDRLVSNVDKRYMRNVSVMRMLVLQGYRSNSDVYSEKEYLLRKKQMFDLFNPQVGRRKFLFSLKLKSHDPLLQELAIREQLNQQKSLSTIIHLSCHNKNGFEISGFIDYAESLHLSNLQVKGCRDWAKVFNESVMLKPKSTDLSYYNWHKNEVYSHNTENYLVQPKKTLTFMHRGDHKKLYTNNLTLSQANGYTRLILFSKKYGHVVIYDHIIRKKI